MLQAVSARSAKTCQNANRRFGIEVSTHRWVFGPLSRAKVKRPAKQEVRTTNPGYTSCPELLTIRRVVYAGNTLVPRTSCWKNLMPPVLPVQIPEL